MAAIAAVLGLLWATWATLRWFTWKARAIELAIRYVHLANQDSIKEHTQAELERHALDLVSGL